MTVNEVVTKLVGAAIVAAAEVVVAVAAVL